MTRVDGRLTMRALLLAFARREWRDTRNAYLTLAVLVLAAMLGDAEGLKAGALLQTPVFNVLRLKYAAVWLSVVLGIVLAARLQADRRDGWLTGAIVSGAIRPRQYLLSVSLVSL